MSYVKNVFIAVDQLINTVLGGWPDETLSSRAWRWKGARIRAWPCRIIDLFLFFDRAGSKGHCQLSYESERCRMQMPPELR